VRSFFRKNAELGGAELGGDLAAPWRRRGGLAAAGSKANVQIYRVNFMFGELLPNYLPPS